MIMADSDSLFTISISMLLLAIYANGSYVLFLFWLSQL